MTDEGLVDFLYVLARDHLPTGQIRQIINGHVTAKPGHARHYSDPHLEAWAKERAEEILSVEYGSVTYDRGLTTQNR